MGRKSIGLGCVFSMTTSTGSTTWTVLGGVRNASGPVTSADDVDTSTLDNNPAERKTFQRGQSDPGEITFTLAHNSTDPSQKKLVTADNKGNMRHFKFTPPSTTEPAETLAGYVKGLGREGMAADSMITRPVTIKVSGSPGFTST
jgi:hypothetical protein